MQSHILVLIKYVRLTGFFIASCSVIGFLEPLYSLADLFNHFRIQAVLGLAFCLIAAAFLKDRKGGIFFFLLLCLNISIVGYKLYQTSGIPSIPSGQLPSLSIVTANVLTSNDDYDRLLSMAEHEKPDFIMLVEVNNAWIENLRPLENTYKYNYKLPSEDNFGMAAYSKVPFRGSVKYAGSAGLPILIAELENGITILGIHPLPPASEWDMVEQDMYFKELALISEKKTGHVIATGDFNTTLWSKGIQPVIKAGFKRINPLGIAYTWPTTSFVFAIQIDHFFGKNIEAADFRVLTSIGSDHYPIRADILVKDPVTN